MSGSQTDSGHADSTGPRRGGRFSGVRAAVVVVAVGTLVVVSCAGRADDGPDAAHASVTAAAESGESPPSEAVDEDTLARPDSTGEADSTIPDESADGVGSSDAPRPVGSEPTASPDATSSGDDRSAEEDAPAGGEDVALDPDQLHVLGPTVVREIDEEVPFGTGVSAVIADVEAVEVVGQAPGDRSGPGVLVEVEVTNDSPETISLDAVTVDLIRRDGASAVPVASSDRAPLEGDLDPGATASGHYQFYIPAEQRSSAFISVSYASGVATALFTGDLPDA